MGSQQRWVAISICSGYVSVCIQPGQISITTELKYYSAGNQVVFINNCIFTLGYKGDYKLLSDLIKSCGHY